jgi:phosphoesterase RecJ-like protein
VTAITAKAWQAGTEAVTGADRLLLLAHVSPDGDALGCALAVGLALDQLPGERKVQVSFGDDPFVVPANLSWLPGQDLLVPPAEVDEAPDIVVTFDASSADRLGTLQELSGRAPTLLVVDHHASYDGFGSLELVDVTAPATAVIADELIRRLGVELNPDIAACLYTGLVTDTGSFRYHGTTPATHELAGRLLATGIPFDEIARNLFDSVPFPFLGLLGQALDEARLDPDAADGDGLVWTFVGADERNRRGLAFDLVEPIIDVVRKSVEAEVALVVKEDDAGVLKVSMRSKGNVDVGAVAVRLGGGGHRYAAGFTASTRDVDELVRSVRDQLPAGITA